MSASPILQFEIPNEMRAVAERSVQQAKVAFQQLLQAAQEAVSPVEERVTASQVGALDTSKKAMSFAERNVLSSFEFAQKIVQTKDNQKLVRMQTEFVQSQMQTLGEHVKDLAETVCKAAMDSKKTSKTRGLPELRLVSDRSVASKKSSGGQAAGRATFPTRCSDDL